MASYRDTYQEVRQAVSGTVTARYAKVTMPQMRAALEELYQEVTAAD
ncbi:MAG: hypothetical protein WCI67_14150 [Chloroflexales bacterium]